MRFLVICGIFAALIMSAIPSLAKTDPRPVVVVLGEFSSTGFGAVPAWQVLMGKEHPEWNIQSTIVGDKKIGDTLKAADVDAIINSYDHIDAFIIFLGTTEALTAAYDKNDAAAVGKEMKAILATVKANAKTTKASLCLITPVPIIDSRLDKWQKPNYNKGEEKSDAISVALMAAAQDAGVPVIDAHKMIKDEKGGDGVPGLLLGSLGFRVRDWGNPLLMKKLMPEIVKTVDPQSADPVAFAAWKAEQQAIIDFDKIMANTSEGIPNIGNELPITTDGKVELVKIPAELLIGSTFDFMYKAVGEKTYAVISPVSDVKQTRPIFTVKYEKVTKDDKGVESKTIETMAIEPDPADWRVIDEAQPTMVTDISRFHVNIMKERFVMVVGNEPGKQLWGLERYSLDALNGQKIISAELRFNYLGSAEEKINGKYVGTGYTWGKAQLFPILGADKKWVNSSATWKTRDGVIGWSGGKVDTAARKTKLTEFLATNPPASVADSAKAELAKL